MNGNVTFQLNFGFNYLIKNEFKSEICSNLDGEYKEFISIEFGIQLFNKNKPND